MFWFELAGHLGYTVGELQERMTWREFRRWIWLYENHPFGELAADLRTADMMIFHGNLNSQKNKRQKLMYIGQEKGSRKRSSGIVAKDAEEAGRLLRKLAGHKD